MTEGRTSDKLRETLVSPLTPDKNVLRPLDNDFKEEEELTTSEEALSIEDAILHGVPLMMYKCKFQAHLARVDSVQDARAVFRAVSSQIAKEAGLREYVCPFAFRLSCGGTQKTPLRLEEPPTEKQGHESITDEAVQEGFCDNDDVGSGERLLYLLQNWNVEHGVVVVVSRINGGFMMAELLGIRRYKFVVDRAKRLLENSVLAGADSNPTTASDSCIGLPFREALANEQKYNSAYRTPDSIDTQALPGTMMQFSSVGQTRDEWPIGRQVAGRGTTPQRNVFQSGRTSNKRIGGATGISTRNRERQLLSLARLRISSDTMGFPQGHVPSMMGDRGYGVKRGRINHFEFPTPGRDSVTTGIEEAINCPKGLGYEDGSGDPNPRDVRRQIARPCVQLAATTGLRKGGHNISASCGNTSARKIRASSQSSIESYRDRFQVEGRNLFETESSSMAARFSAVIAGVGCGVSEDHPLCPPPPSAEEVGQNRGEDGLEHNGLLSAAGETVDKPNKKSSCDYSPVKTSDASSSGFRGREFRHQAPSSVFLGTTGVSRAGELTITHRGDDGNYNASKGSPGLAPSIFQGIHGKSLSRREDDDYEAPVRRGSVANGLPLPTIRKD